MRSGRFAFDCASRMASGMHALRWLRSVAQTLQEARPFAGMDAHSSLLPSTAAPQTRRLSLPAQIKGRCPNSNADPHSHKGNENAYGNFPSPREALRLTFGYRF